MSVYGWSVFWLIVGLWLGWYARGYLDRLFVQELMRRRLNKDWNVYIKPASPTDSNPSTLNPDPSP